MRLRLFLIVVGAVLVIATFTFPTWQPIIEQRGPTPVELFPGLAAQLQTAFASLPQEQQRAYLAFAQQDQTKALAMVVAALGPRNPVPTEEQSLPNLNAPVIIGSGTFQHLDAVRWAQGTANIYQDAANSLTLHLDGFSMLDGPDLHLYLSAADAPATSADMKAGGVDPLDVGALKASVGGQNYVLPDNTDLTQYRSVAIYSSSLDLIYTYAPLFVRK